MPTGKAFPEFLSELDERHASVLRAIERFRTEHEYSPTARDVAEMVHYPLSSVRVMIDRLVASGFLVRPNGLARAIRPARDGEREKTLADAWEKRIAELSRDEQRAVVIAAARFASLVRVLAPTTEQQQEAPP